MQTQIPKIKDPSCFFLEIFFSRQIRLLENLKCPPDVSKVALITFEGAITGN